MCNKSLIAVYSKGDSSILCLVRKITLSLFHQIGDFSMVSGGWTSISWSDIWYTEDFHKPLTIPDASLPSIHLNIEHKLPSTTQICT